jgi:hypothetical protein
VSQYIPGVYRETPWNYWKVQSRTPSVELHLEAQIHLPSPETAPNIGFAATASAQNLFQHAS